MMEYTSRRRTNGVKIGTSLNVWRSIFGRRMTGLRGGELSLALGCLSLQRYFLYDIQTFSRMLQLLTSYWMSKYRSYSSRSLTLWMWNWQRVQLSGLLRAPWFWVVGVSISNASSPDDPFNETPDGAARIGSTLFGELLNAVFAKVGQSAVRRVARETFEHLLNLDLKFHLSRQTGGLTRAIDRGTK